MPTSWPARLGLVSASVLALAACNRGQPASAPAASDALAASDSVAADETMTSTSTDVAEPLPASQASAPVAPAAAPAAVAAAPEIAAAQSFDQQAATAAADDDSTTEAYSFSDEGQPVRVWNDPGRGARIVLPGGAISYYRPGAAEPYLLRDAGVFYVLNAGRIVRAYDQRGRAVTIRPDVRSRYQTVITRSRTVRKEADRRRPPAAQRPADRRDNQRPGDRSPAEARRDDARADAARDNARDASRDARQAQAQADKARDRAQDAQRDANKAKRQADTPRQDAAARDAQRQANKADRQADRAADKAKDTAKDAKDARKQAKQCARQQARGEKVDADCKA